MFQIVTFLQYEISVGVWGCAFYSLLASRGFLSIGRKIISWPLGWSLEMLEHWIDQGTVVIDFGSEPVRKITADGKIIHNKQVPNIMATLNKQEECAQGALGILPWIILSCLQLLEIQLLMLAAWAGLRTRVVTWSCRRTDQFFIKIVDYDWNFL